MGRIRVGVIEFHSSSTLNEMENTKGTYDTENIKTFLSYLNLLHLDASLSPHLRDREW